MGKMNTCLYKIIYTFDINLSINYMQLQGMYLHRFHIFVRIIQYQTPLYSRAMVTNTIIDQAVNMSSNKPPSLAAWKYARPITPLIAWFMGPTLGLSGADRTHVAPCWPHEPCYLGYICMSGLVNSNVVLTVHSNGYIKVGKWQVTWIALRDMVIIARHVEEFVLSFLNRISPIQIGRAIAGDDIYSKYISMFDTPALMPDKKNWFVDKMCQVLEYIDSNTALLDGIHLQ